MFLTIVSAAIAVDYCSKDICSAQNHVACKNTGDFGSSCPTERSVVPMTPEVIALLLQKHNTARMNIASGKVSGFSTANKMIQMVGVWEHIKVLVFGFIKYFILNWMNIYSSPGTMNWQVSLKWTQRRAYSLMINVEIQVGPNQPISSFAYIYNFMI